MNLEVANGKRTFTRQSSWEVRASTEWGSTERLEETSVRLTMERNPRKSRGLYNGNVDVGMASWPSLGGLATQRRRRLSVSRSGVARVVVVGATSARSDSTKRPAGTSGPKRGHTRLATRASQLSAGYGLVLTPQKKSPERLKPLLGLSFAMEAEVGIEPAYADLQSAA